LQLCWTRISMHTGGRERERERSLFFWAERGDDLNMVWSICDLSYLMIIVNETVRKINIIFFFTSLLI